MARYNTNDSSPEGPSNSPGRFKRYRFEFGPGQLILWSFALLLGLSWMFVFGILIGRGVPIVETQDLTFKTEIMKFLGLGRKPPPPVANAAETWASPDKILKSLDYYEDLAHNNHQPPAAEKKPVVLAAQSHPVKNPIPESDKPFVPLPVPAQPPATHASSTEPEQSNHRTPSAPQQISESGSEHFTVLLASLREPEHANRMLEQLKSKGYSPRMEVVNLSGSGKWQRILMGSFRTREEAMKFAAEVNRKERMEGLVIKENN